MWWMYKKMWVSESVSTWSRNEALGTHGNAHLYCTRAGRGVWERRSEESINGVSWPYGVEKLLLKGSKMSILKANSSMTESQKKSDTHTRAHMYTKISTHNRVFQWMCRILLLNTLFFFWLIALFLFAWCWKLQTEISLLSCSGKRKNLRQQQAFTLSVNWAAATQASRYVEYGEKMIEGLGSIERTFNAWHTDKQRPRW